VFEAVDGSNRPVPAGAAADKLLITTLTNRVLPLIRYELSDRVTLDPATCGCGRPYARIVGIDGRREEFLRLPRRGGGWTEVHALRLQPALIGLPGVRQFQIVPAGLGLEIRLVLRDGAEASGVRAAAGHAVAILLAAQDAVVDRLAVVVVERIERVGTGAKHRLVAPPGPA
jgi:phenylacetate-coenzyme A ligase PaaK-like adenylate-forming protein